VWGYGILYAGKIFFLSLSNFFKYSTHGKLAV
jgi:hypothetical protein